MTDMAIDSGMQGVTTASYVCSSTGIVYRDQQGSHMKVLRDNRKHAEDYHVKFWQLDHGNEE